MIFFAAVWASFAFWTAKLSSWAQMIIVFRNANEKRATTTITAILTSNDKTDLHEHDIYIRMYIQKENIPYGVWSILSATQRIDGISAYAEFNLCIFIHLFGFFLQCALFCLSLHMASIAENQKHTNKIYRITFPLFSFLFRTNEYLPHLWMFINYKI